MKKFGFTLAEVLVTLGIIGVVAALTLPSLLVDTQGAQVGPKLGKAVAMFEQANQALLNQNNVDSLSDGGFYTSNGDVNGVRSYMDELSNYLKITQYRGETYRRAENDSNHFGHEFSNNGLSWQSKDGVIYTVWFWAITSPPGRARTPQNSMIGALNIDINGPAGPNLPGTDLFGFSLRNDGSLVPAGAVNWLPHTPGDPTWRDLCPNGQTPTSQRYYYCTASIFDNNMKIMYQMR